MGISKGPSVARKGTLSYEQRVVYRGSSWGRGHLSISTGVCPGGLRAYGGRVHVRLRLECQ